MDDFKTYDFCLAYCNGAEYNFYDWLGEVPEDFEGGCHLMTKNRGKPALIDIQHVEVKHIVPYFGDIKGKLKYGSFSEKTMRQAVDRYEKLLMLLSSGGQDGK